MGNQGASAKADQALAVPATPANAVDGPSGFDPSRYVLLPCPWCKAAPRTCGDNSYGEASVDCPNEDCPVRPVALADLRGGETLEDAITRWNARDSCGDVDERSAIIAWLRSEESAARARETETGEAKHAALAIYCREIAKLIEAGEHAATAGESAVAKPDAQPTHPLNPVCKEGGNS